MSCVLRISGSNLSESLSKISLEAYRVENNCAHFTVSEADFDDFKAQIKDAISFLQLYSADVTLLMGNPDASGVLDFAIEWRDVIFQFDTFPAEIVRVAGSFGLSLELSHYPVSEESEAKG
jgi:hypothetical protein